MSHTEEAINALSSFARIEGVKREAIIRFVNDTIDGKPVDSNYTIQAAVLLGGLMQGIRGGDDLNVELRRILKARKARKKMFDPNNATMGTPAWAVVEYYVRGDFSHKEAVKLFQAEVQPASDRQCEAWIAAIKPRVEQTVNYMDALRARAEK